MLAAVFTPAAFASVTAPPAGGSGEQPAAPPETLAAVQDVAHVRPLVTRFHHESAQKTYTVRSGDTLSGIAGKFCGSSGKWPSLNRGNHSEIADPDLILPGQKILLTCDAPALMPSVAAVAAAVSPVHAVPVRHDRFDGNTQYGCGDGDGDGARDMPCSLLHTGASSESDGYRQQAAPVQATAQVTGASGTVGGNVNPNNFGSYEACVISRESGGNSQVMNSSGHYGLFQFSASTWQAYGGNPADFGHASAAEQEGVFNTAMAQGGQSNWSPYDGC